MLLSRRNVLHGLGGLNPHIVRVKKHGRLEGNGSYT